MKIRKKKLDEDKKEETTSSFEEDNTLNIFTTIQLRHFIILAKRHSQFLIANHYLINAKG